MSDNPFELSHPILCALLAGSVFEEDCKTACGMTSAEFTAALEESRFHLNNLIDLLGGALIPEWRDVKAEELERNCKCIVETLGLAKARAVYRDKLLVAGSNALEDVIYEIAVTARACAVLDAGSVDLERPIPDDTKNPEHLKNSDIYGTFQKQPVRIEVTVLHEKPPESVDLDLVEIVKSAKIDAGFRIQMRSAVKDKDSAERVRVLVELLFEHYAEAGGTDVEIDNVRFKWHRAEYLGSPESPIETIRFFRDGDLRGTRETRDISHPVAMRLVTPLYLKEDFPNPRGVVDVTDLPDFPKQAPVSTKVRQMLDGKLEQCESGIINIVAFGNPKPMHDGEVVAALKGAVLLSVPFEETQEGFRRLGEGRVSRAPKAPFNPADKLASDDDRATFIMPFQKLSAVWHIRLGNYAKSEMIMNPNALVNVPEGLSAGLTQPNSTPAASPTATDPKSPAESE